MSATQSAGLLLYRRGPQGLEVLLGHSGGPFWARRDAGAWSIPKGEIAPGEDPLAAARREFREETGLEPEGPFAPLGSIRQKAGKRVEAWAFPGDCDPAKLASGTLELEWPPRSGRRIAVPEIDRFAFFPLAEARRRINPAQAGLLEALERSLTPARP